MIISTNLVLILLVYDTIISNMGFKIKIYYFKRLTHACILCNFIKNIKNKY